MANLLEYENECSEYVKVLKDVDIRKFTSLIFKRCNAGFALPPLILCINYYITTY